MTEIIFDEHEDWEQRILCSDESCIGVIGPDGKCKECQKAYEGDLPEGHGQINVREVVAKETDAGMSDDNPSDEDWDSRVLCSDGACIGVIGPDGTCKECGKPLKD